MNSQKQPIGKKERTKYKIYNIALSLFLEQGYENTTVQQITEKAEVAKGTFFSHFPTKDAILTYLGEQRIELMKDSVANELATIQSANEQIIKLFDILAQANEEDKKITKLISHEILKKFNSPDLEHETDNQLELKDVMESILLKGQQNGEIKKEIHTNHVADILMGIYFYTLLEWLAKDQQASLIKEYRDRVSIVLGGILVERG